MQQEKKIDRCTSMHVLSLFNTHTHSKNFLKDTLSKLYHNIHVLQKLRTRPGKDTMKYDLRRLSVTLHISEGKQTIFNTDIINFMLYFGSLRQDLLSRQTIFDFKLM